MSEGGSRRPDMRSEKLRSHRWLGVRDLRAFGHRSRLRQMGYDRADFAGKPVIAIINTWSDINQCHAHLRIRAEEVKRGIWQAGGFPIELPAMSLSEPFVKPTTMLYRNMLAMEVEELLRWRRPVGRLRQDHPGTSDGGDLHGVALHLRAGWADAARQLARPSPGLRFGCLEVLG